MEIDKILIPYYNVEDILSIEVIFGKMVEHNKYIIENIPLYTKNLALGDLLLVEKLADGKLYFEDLLETSENSTIRIVFYEYNFDIVHKITKEIEAFGCNWVGFEGGSYFSINVNKNLNYQPIKEYMEINKDILDLEEACLSEKHQKDIKLLI